MPRLLPWVLCAVFAAACGSESGRTATPLSPTPALGPQIASYAGEWVVTYHVDSCIGRYCFTRVRRDQSMTLRLTQMGDRVTGAFLSDGLVADVEGRVDAEGRLTLSGREPSPIPRQGSLELLRFEASLDESRGMTGALQYQSLIPGEYSWYSTGATGPIVGGTRSPLRIDSFTGSWRGFFNTTACVGASYCLLDAWSDLELELDDSAGRVSGTLRLGGFLRVPLTGVVAGDSLELVHADGARNTTAITVRRSPTGRLTGAATLTGVAFTNAPWTTTIDLLSVALVPPRP